MLISVSGGTRDIGSALTKMCMRHRSIEAKLKQFSMCFLEGLINPLQEQMEDWKRGVNTLDKDHAKEYKRARQEIKKKSSDTLKLQKKAKKGKKTFCESMQPFAFDMVVYLCGKWRQSFYQQLTIHRSF
ncbi:Metastasis suppressor protein 1 [Ataeniobius toweri]|uniref:Metastasis suppressor protein 1 n=1 Tax=Ataeniobius toweri TaxID=208326 RepID=A0ABU7CIA9_9TELE|nr:Metastasis suppressor protein 1 [Ataeniobius toweri]